MGSVSGRVEQFVMWAGAAARAAHRAARSPGSPVAALAATGGRERRVFLHERRVERIIEKGNPATADTGVADAAQAGAAAPTGFSW